MRFVIRIRVEHQVVCSLQQYQHHSLLDTAHGMALLCWSLQAGQRVRRKPRYRRWLSWRPLTPIACGRRRLPSSPRSRQRGSVEYSTTGGGECGSRRKTNLSRCCPMHAVLISASSSDGVYSCREVFWEGFLVATGLSG